MKKYLSSILLFALLIISACQDDIIPIVDDGTKDGTKVTSPIFHVSIAGDDVRTQLNNSLKLEWVAGDQISIKCGDLKAIYTTNTSGTDVDFVYVSGDKIPSEGPFEAYYPASLADNAVLPADQTYLANNISGFPMRAVSDDTNLSFKHLCSILELNLTTSDSGLKVGGISLESAEGMSGGFSLNGDAARISSDAGNVDMEIADSLALGSTAAKIYLAVPDGTYAKGMKYIVKTNKGWRVFTSNKALTFTRAHITPADLTVAEAKLSKFRTSNDAKQTWTYTNSIMSATNANVTETDKSKCFIEMLADFNQTAQLKISGKKFTFDGLGHTITVTSLTVDSSILPATSSDVTFKNVTIQGPGTASTYQNRAIAFESDNTVTLEDCVIKDFNSTINGAALWGQGTLILTGKSKIENCHSTGSLGGGAIFCSNGSVQIGDGVTISGCSASNNAGAVYMHSVGNLTIGRATIKNCSATKNGGAIVCGNALSGVGSTITVTGATISDCSAKDGGCISATCGTSTFDGVTISACTNTGNGGSIYMTGGTVELNNSVIDGGNAYMTTAGTLNITNSTYTYTGIDYALSVEGTSNTANKGTISVNGNSVIKATSGSGAYAKYGRFDLTNSTLIVNGYYGARFNTYGEVTLTNANIVNKKAGGHVLYSSTSNGNSSLTVNGGYYSGSSITGWYTSGDDNRITINVGYFSNNVIDNATIYGTSVSLQKLTTPFIKTIDGVEYSFTHYAASATSQFHNPTEENIDN